MTVEKNASDLVIAGLMGQGEKVDRAMAALEAMSPSEAHALLMRALEGASPEGQVAAAGFLMRWGSVEHLPLLQAALASPDQGVRRRASRFLSRLEENLPIGQESCEAFESFFHGPAVREALGQDRLVVVELACGMLSFGDPQSLPLLLESLACPDAEVSVTAARGLSRLIRLDPPPGSIHTRADLRRLLDPYLDHEDGEVCRYIAIALAGLGDPGPIPLLISALGEDNLELKRLAVEALGLLSPIYGRLISTRLEDDLARKLQDHPDLWTRALSCSLLVILGRLTLDDAQDHLVTALLSGPGSLKRLVARCLPLLSEITLEGVEVLAKAALTVKDSYVQSMGVDALLRTDARSDQALAHLQGLFQDQLPQSIEIAACWGLKGKEWEQRLEGAMAWADKDHRALAAVALHKMGSSRGLDELLAIFDGPDERLKARHILLLASPTIAPREALPRILAFLEHPRLQAHAMDALYWRVRASVKDEGMKALLLGLLELDRLSIRTAAAICLVELMGEISEAPRLMEALGSKELDMGRGCYLRVRSARALARAGVTEAQAALAEAVNDGNPEMGLAAALALRELGFAEGDGVLTETLASSHPMHRFYAAKGLARAGVEQGVAALEQIATDTFSPARDWALRGLFAYAIERARPTALALLRQDIQRSTLRTAARLILQAGDRPILEDLVVSGALRPGAQRVVQEALQRAE